MASCVLICTQPLYFTPGVHQWICLIYICASVNWMLKNLLRIENPWIFDGKVLDRFALAEDCRKVLLPPGVFAVSARRRDLPKKQLFFSLTILGFLNASLFICWSWFTRHAIAYIVKRIIIQSLFHLFVLSYPLISYFLSKIIFSNNIFI